jgi:NAD(P)-dependent dehydrogenase (short-subunit alcohol dehydrogenase family)
MRKGGGGVSMIADQITIVVAYLASDEAAFVTGQVLEVDGIFVMM